MPNRIVRERARIGIWTGAIGVLLSLSLVAGGCATTSQSRKVETAGFLGDYSQLREGEGDEAQLVYVAPGVDWSGFDAVLIDSVTIWRTESTDDISAEDQQRLTDYLYQAIQEQLSPDYRIAERPGPGVLRLRVAITEARGANVTLNTVTTVVPQLRAATTLGGMATGTSTLVGKAAIEGEITDSLSGRRLLAAVDTRQGTKTLRGGMGAWSDAERAFDYWSERIRERLKELRG